MNKLLSSTVAIFTLAMSAAAPTWADRPRPVIMDSTLLTGDTHKPLRGVRWALDINNTIPSLAELQALRAENGLNALHVYAEARYTCTDPGLSCREGLLDDLVARAKQADIYLVITIGGGNPDGTDSPVTRDQFEIFAKAFWDHYASRYANEEHVIYEVQNETWFIGSTRTAQPSPNWVLDFEADIYKSIRADAPDTPVLLFTYAFFHSASGVNQDIAAVEARVAGGIDWTKTGIAFHGYSGTNVTEATVQALQSAGKALVETELSTSPSDASISFPLVLSHEHTITSWFSFLEPFPSSPTNHAWAADFRDPLTNPADQMGGIIWAAEAGTWPAFSNPPAAGTFVSLYAPVFNSFVRVDVSASSTAPPLIANAATATSDTYLEIASGSGGKPIRFIADVNRQWVKVDVPCAVEYCSSAVLKALSPWTLSSFEWLTRSVDGRVALRDLGSNYFVSADYNHGSPPTLYANRRRGGGSWEGFTVTVH